MAAIPPLTITPTTEIEIEDSCNCCWGRPVKKKTPAKISRSYSETMAAKFEQPVRDSHDIYNFDVVVVQTPEKHRKDSGSHHKEVKQ